MKRHRTRFVTGSLILMSVWFLGMTLLGGTAYFHFADPAQTCASCHEMGAVHAAWNDSAHRTLHCRNCHGGSLTLDAHAMKSHLNRVVQHFTGDPDQPIHLSERDVLALHNTCQDCHPSTFNDWQSGSHAVPYASIFLDPRHNAMEQPANDCLRCHGMFHDGGIDSLLTPLDKTGPWSFIDPQQLSQPVIPCLACHQIHTDTGTRSAASLYDHREKTHLALQNLPEPKIHDGELAVPVSSDLRQRLCVQCHAPDAHHLLGTSDDRTPTGVHAGLSCMDCHSPHRLNASVSCASCHPGNSHCGLDVTTMDTSFAFPGSQNDIHTVSCADCHTDGRPGTGGH